MIRKVCTLSTSLIMLFWLPYYLISLFPSPYLLADAFTTTGTTTLSHRNQKISSICLNLVSDCFAREQGKDLVERFGSVWEHDIEKVYAFETLLLSESRLQILHESLDYIHQKSSTRLGSHRWPLRLFSTRATMGCFDRLLNQMLVEPKLLLPTEDEKPRIEQEADMSRDQYNLLRLLQILSTSQGGVYTLERQVCAQQR